VLAIAASAAKTRNPCICVLSTCYFCSCCVTCTHCHSKALNTLRLEDCEGVAWGHRNLASIMLIKLAVNGRCALPVPFARVTGAHKHRSTTLPLMASTGHKAQLPLVTTRLTAHNAQLQALHTLSTATASHRPATHRLPRC
jgi:hypothetical protein